jgi:hypothetical protein
MDFNTGTGGTRDSGGGSPPGTSGPPPRASGTAAAEFDYRDPVQTFIATVQAVVLRPVDFFRSISPQGDFLNPLIFAVICYEISAILGGIIALALGSQGFGGFLVDIILAPIGVAILLFIGAGIIHLLVMLIVGTPNAGYEGTFRVGAYIAVTQLVAWLSAIPILGILVALLIFFYTIFLGVVGIREMHSTTTGKAALVILIPVVVAFLIVLVLALVIGAVIWGAILSQQ